MKRRRLLQSLMASPAAAAAAQAATPPPAPQAASPATEQFPALKVTAADAATDGVIYFFSSEQFLALTRLCEAIAPAGANRPSAVDADVPAFLDFFIGQSPAATKALYRDGLDRLVRDGVAGASLSALKDSWSCAGPADAFARFLQQAKNDILQATMNSREWAAAQGRASRRDGMPTGYFWRHVD
ncbi:MAG: gluconate 2-dehydrogenase subunit 3 family protein [Acidobacteria bacterium]|nr:gluconate 2-dehydrogenase subunit 3 family protein [Acidobacteriota bacterium]